MWEGAELPPESLLSQLPCEPVSRASGEKCSFPPSFRSFLQMWLYRKPRTGLSLSLCLSFSGSNVNGPAHPMELPNGWVHHEAG